jgi:hypothetical protein
MKCSTLARIQLARSTYFSVSRHEIFWDIRGFKNGLRGFTNENERLRVEEKECRFKHYQFHFNHGIERRRYASKALIHSSLVISHDPQSQKPKPVPSMLGSTYIGNVSLVIAVLSGS